MIDSFAVGSMHCVHQKTVWRFFAFLQGKTGKKQGKTTISILESAFQSIGRRYGSLKFPKEFTKSPRTFEQFDHFKATELRMLLTYGGDMVLQPEASQYVTMAFRFLSVGIRILSDKRLYEVSFCTK